MGQSEKKYRELVETLKDVLCSMDEQGVFTYVSPSIQALAGYTPAEVVGRPFADFVYHEDLSRSMEDFQRVLSGQFDEDEYRILNKAGDPRWIRASFRPIIEGNHATGAHGVVTDITEHRRVENQIETNLSIQRAISSVLQLSLEPITLEEILQRTLDLIVSVPWLAVESKGSVFVVEEDPHVLVMKARTGLSKELLVACSRVPVGKCLCGKAAAVRKIVFADCPDDRHDTRCTDMPAHGHYCVPILSEHELHGVINLYVKEGHERDTEEETFLVSVADILAGTIERKRAENELRQHRDQLEDLVAERASELTKANERLRREVAERVRAENALRETVERFDLAVRGTNDGLWDWDVTTNESWVSPRFKELLGYEDCELEEPFDLWRSLLHPDDRDVVMQALRDHFERRVPYDIEYRLRTRGEDWRWFAAQGEAIWNAEGKAVRMAGSLRDITNRRCREEDLRASICEKEVLLQEIHHRVKNNMQVISSMLNLQSRYLDDPETVDVFREMRRRVTSMAIVHEQLYQSPDVSRIDFAKHVRSLASYLFRSYGRTSATIAFNTDIQDVHVSLELAVPCGLIINELVSNALKYAFPDGRTGEICVTLRSADDRSTLVVFNDGVGVPADLDIHASTTMGLQMVRTLVDQLDGVIELDRHGGTSFKITFPALE